MHITEIASEYLPPLGSFDLYCNGHVNLFIGPNASGKSTILRAIEELHSLALSGESPPVRGTEAGEIYNAGDTGMLYLNYPDVTEDGPVFAMAASDDWPRDTSGSGAPMWNVVPFLYIPAVRVNLPGMDIFGQTIQDAVNITINDKPKHLFETESGIFNGRRVERRIAWLREEIRGTNQQRQFRRALQLGYSCARRICSEVIHDTLVHSYVESHRRLFGGEEILQVHYNMGIVTSDDILGDPLYAGALSSGTQGTLLWVWALALELANHYHWEVGWYRQPAILLIDEIENHLHPTWQRRVIPALLEHFPSLQIFATTHSPFVVAGLKAGQVHLLKRDENGVVTATTNEEDVIGWTADEILRNMMGVDEPTDQLTVDRANRLRQLREKDRLTDEEESELNELRRQVNEDLLSKSGPLEAQRERYGELMERFLLSRQSELTQDGD